MNMSYDKLLHIETEKVQVGFNKSYHYHRYEPTPYEDLEKLVHVFPLRQTDCVVDFGCGKGRLNFFLHYLFKSTVKGIEMNKEFYLDAMRNVEQYSKRNKRIKEKILFYHCKAEDYTIQEEDNCFYFFNPFSIQVFQKIMNNILCSLEQTARTVTIIIYYPSEDYQLYMNNHSIFNRTHEVEVGIRKNKEKEKFIIYQNVM